jgi:hypothetical protein
MVFPYRTPASIDPEPQPEGVRTRTLDRWVRAVSGAAVLFLLTATAMMFALMRDIVESRRFHGNPAIPHLAHNAAHEVVAAPPPPPPRAAPPPPPHPARSAPRTFIAPLGLASLGATTHDPATLLARAARLRADGASITITRSSLAISLDRALEESFAPHARIGARWDLNGIEIQALPAGSSASLVGLQRGDVLTAINGYAFVTPEMMFDAHRSLVSTGVALIEVLRAEQRIVLEVRVNPALRPRVSER